MIVHFMYMDKILFFMYKNGPGENFVKTVIAMAREIVYNAQ